MTLPFCIFVFFTKKLSSEKQNGVLNDTSVPLVYAQSGN